MRQRYVPFDKYPMKESRFAQGRRTYLFFLKLNLKVTVQNVEQAFSDTMYI